MESINHPGKIIKSILVDRLKFTYFDVAKMTKAHPTTIMRLLGGKYFLSNKMADKVADIMKIYVKDNQYAIDPEYWIKLMDEYDNFLRKSKGRK